MNKILLVLAMVFSTAAFAGDNCIMKASIDGFTNATDTSVVVDAGPSTAYLVTTMGYCDGLSFSEDIRFKTWPEDSMEVCEGDSIIVGSDIGPNECVIDTIAPTTAK